MDDGDGPPEACAAPLATPDGGEPPAPPAAPGFDLDERERRVLAQLPIQGGGGTGFEGLRRRLDLHPQSLTRVLDRLADRGLVVEAEGGYRRGPEAEEALATEPPAVPGCPREPVAAGTLPPGVDPDDVRDELAGRWFEGLRWYGWRDRADGTDLVWLTDPDHAMILLRLTRDRYLVGGEPRDPTAAAHPSVAAAPIVKALGEVVGDAPAAPRDPAAS